MNPLLFADWGKLNRILCFIMWMVAIVLLIFILSHVGDDCHLVVHHTPRPIARP